MTQQADEDKLKALAERISKAKQAAQKPMREGEYDKDLDAKGLTRKVRVGTDFLATVLASLGLGWFVDEQMGTAPWFMIGFIVAGFVIACYQLVVAVSAFDKTKNEAEKK